MSSLQDTGLVYPACEYNLTGLDEAHCPGCGRHFTWEEVRDYVQKTNPPTAFEKAVGWRKMPAFFVTWLTVLFLPWMFARQVVQQAGTAAALLFGAMCFAGTGLAFLSGMDGPFWAAWLGTGLLYLLVQTLLLSLVDPLFYHTPLMTLRFWLRAGAYTSAIMLTEIIYGPPILDLSVVGLLLQGKTSQSPFGFFLNDNPGEGLLQAAQILIWLVALGCCIVHRRRQAGWLIGWAVLFALLPVLLLGVLYAIMVQFVGINFYALCHGGLFP